MELKIIEWNIGGAASLGWNDSSKTRKPYEISKDIVDKIIEQKADIIVLTEFVAVNGLDNLFDSLEENEYIWFLKCETGKNGILIAIKKELVNENIEGLITDIYHKKVVASSDNDCNILRVDFPLKCGSMLTVIGCRMETGAKNLKEQYDSEGKSFDEVLIPMIKTSKDLCIICGDFNNARCLGNLNEKYKIGDYIGKSQLNYNLNIIKDKLVNFDFVMMDVDENGGPIPTHKGYLPEDHIFVRGSDKKECRKIFSDGLSDHDIITATVEIRKEKADKLC